MAKTKKLVAALTRRGPHRVLRGDLAFAGLPGVVYTPAEGLNLPAVAFGHDWLTRAGRYAETLAHLASWGIVAAAPDTERSIAPSVLDFASDLGTTCDIVSAVRLGPGEISVHPERLAVAGHGFGASAAVFAAAGMAGRVRAVAALFPSVTTPSATLPAAGLRGADDRSAGLVLAGPADPMALRSNALELARAWDGAVLRTATKAKAGGLVEGRRLARAFGVPGADRGTQKIVRALLTGYLLSEIAGDRDYRDFADPDAELPGTEIADPQDDPVAVESKIVALLKP